MMDRFYVREHSGYFSRQRNSRAKPRTEVMVIDRDYCHTVMRSWVDDPFNSYPDRALARHRAAAAALCEELNTWAA